MQINFSQREILLSHSLCASEQRSGKNQVQKKTSFLKSSPWGNCEFQVIENILVLAITLKITVKLTEKLRTGKEKIWSLKSTGKKISVRRRVTFPLLQEE